MKRMGSLLLAALLLAVLAGCAGKETEKEVDLAAFFAEESGRYEAGNLEEITTDMLDTFYPGLSEISCRQFVAKMPLMSSVVNEFIFLQCEKQEDAAKAAEILQKRIDEQAGGGAWYPASMEAWKAAKVISHGSYVAMIASASYQTQWEAAYQALFD